jgi:paraquat-inducible protein B
MLLARTTPSRPRRATTGNPLEPAVQLTRARARRRRENRFSEARVRPRLRYSWIWLTPLIALVLVGYLIYSFAAEHGPLISITFEKADGLTEQQTQVKYKAVTLGTVESIELSPDLSHVVVKVRMTARAESMLTADTRFWVVRPRLGSGLRGFQAGLETLVSAPTWRSNQARPGASA